ncbi:MAG: YggS family pyridoxal phosphate-dependent enzyme [Phycisphaerales bacterium]|nr:YggS family pyridoxal phosphate-dependent enzyme [Phycisphaerales bacterium]
MRRYEEVRSRIGEAAARSGGDPDRVVLVAVTKYASIAQVRELIEAGHVDYGESRMQHFIQFAAQVEDFLERHRELGGGEVPEAVRWHFIGHLQRNKVRKIIPLTRLIHSVDSLRLAEEIQNSPGQFTAPTEILVQVNTSGEKGKYGIAPAATAHVIDQIDTMLNVRVRGLMCMAPRVEDPVTLRPVFERTRELFEDIRKTGVVGSHFDILSMGMSSDYEVAVECGANVVRVGSAIFGERAEDETEAVAASAESD